MLHYALKDFSKLLAERYGPDVYYFTSPTTFGYSASFAQIAQLRMNGDKPLLIEGRTVSYNTKMQMVFGATPYCCGMYQAYGFSGTETDKEAWDIFFRAAFASRLQIPTILWLNKLKSPSYNAVREITKLIVETRNRGHDSIIETRMYVPEEYQQYVYDNTTPERSR